ncbi:hypothetical protein [uncultured Erythrobacter sp.]|uniref:hypothetical protein n=1 Tax=uncultured Erythrobacter sp. TaxID=263913 RepID=UPI002629F476|nr:hypothetical protein [uncultured Erythrobacter sp.]
MKAIYLQAAGALALTFGIAACVPQAQPPAPAPPPVVTPAPTPTPTPPPPPVVEEPVYDSYLDAPQTPGTWLYVEEPGETLAVFGTGPGEGRFLVRCAAGRIYLGRATETPATQSRAMSITTETTTRRLQANPVPRRDALLAVELDPRDSILDAMALSKGRIAIGVEGEHTLYLPAWVEISRVIEDCR